MSLLAPVKPSVLPSTAFQPLFHTSLGEDALDLAAACGLFLDEWQGEILKTSLTFREDGLFAARRMVLLVPRQQGKNVILEARELASIFLLKEKLIFHSAHEYKTAQQSFVRLRERVEVGADLFDLQVRYRNSGADTSIFVPKDKGKGRPDNTNIVFSTRTKGAGRGLSIDLLIFDEAYALTDEQSSALNPTQNAVDNPQAWITSSTGFEDSAELLMYRNMGLNQVGNVGFFEYKADDKSDPGDEAQWFKAIPGLTSGRQNIQEIRDQYEAAKSKGDFTSFNRETLGLWATTELDPVITDDCWKSLLDEGAAVDGRIAFAVDVAPDGSSACVYAAGLTADGLYVVQMAADDNGTHWLPEYLRQVQDKYNPSAIALDSGGPAGACLNEILAAGVEVRQIGAGEVVNACGQFFNMATGNRLRHKDDESLRLAVKAGVKRMVGSKGAWAWTRKSPEDNITYLVAATNALYAFTAFEDVKPKGGRVW